MNARSSALVWLAAVPVACTPSRPAGPPHDAARAPAVSVAAPPPAPATPPASSSASTLPARQRAPAARHDADDCKPLHGPGLVSRGSQTYVQAKTRAECTHCNGDWGRHGLAGVVGCLCRTPDAGKPCESPHDCTAECVVGRPGETDPKDVCPAVGAALHGHCAGQYTTFGCHSFIVEKSTPGGVLRGVQTLCID